jgi:hypothetical protein
MSNKVTSGHKWLLLPQVDCHKWTTSGFRKRTRTRTRTRTFERVRSDCSHKCHKWLPQANANANANANVRTRSFGLFSQVPQVASASERERELERERSNAFDRSGVFRGDK